MLENFLKYFEVPNPETCPGHLLHQKSKTLQQLWTAYKLQLLFQNTLSRVFAEVLDVLKQPPEVF